MITAGESRVVRLVRPHRNAHRSALWTLAGSFSTRSIPRNLDCEILLSDRTATPRRAAARSLGVSGRHRPICRPKIPRRSKPRDPRGICFMCQMGPYQRPPNMLKEAKRTALPQLAGAEIAVERAAEQHRHPKEQLLQAGKLPFGQEIDKQGGNQVHQHPLEHLAVGNRSGGQRSAAKAGPPARGQADSGRVTPGEPAPLPADGPRPSPPSFPLSACCAPSPAPSGWTAGSTSQ